MGKKKHEIATQFLRLKLARQDLVALKRVAKFSKISLSDLIQIILVKEIDRNNWLEFTKTEKET